jgi:hypothetical protein
MTAEPEEWLILGVTSDGRTFRPSDWPERLCGALARYEDGRLSYSPHARPVSRQGKAGVVVEAVLQVLDPEGFDFVMGFARDNLLEIVPGRTRIRETSPTPLAI